MYHRMVEAFKFMFALRSQLGDTKCDDCDGDAVWSVVDNMTRLVWRNKGRREGEEKKVVRPFEK